MSDDEVAEVNAALKLLYPYYLDTDMSMAFAAALAGGVALEHEQTDQSSASLQSVRNLGGGFRFNVLSAEARSDKTEGSDVASVSKMVRRHTEASVFIELFNELRSRQLVLDEPQFDDIGVGAIVTLQAGPATSPLRRVLDQALRFLDVMLEGISAFSPPKSKSGGQKQGQRQGLQASAEPDAAVMFSQMRKVVASVRDDLDHNGMVDIVVRRESGYSVLVTLDSQFLTPTALELLHSSQFTVVGKVTHRWTEADEPVILTRRSALGLIPAAGSTGVGLLFGALVMLARGITQADVANQVFRDLGLADDDDDVPEPSDDDITLSAEVVDALNLVLHGPAIQVLPLAICA